MKRFVIFLFSISVVLNIYLLLDKLIFSVPDPSPIWDPFDINFDMTFDAMIADNYEWIPEDVPILGKTLDSITIYYQFSNHDFYASIDYEKPRTISNENAFKSPNYDEIILEWRYFEMEMNEFN